ncbi:SpoIIE family protein phosphatase [Rhabdobacter roseus]|uniref:Sigma-B regulation protein RsbU (Phosphoserine phosphatase) n=1 Tax=Rhabdobacter roseus TaxID=1655419 RepID=A0A840TN48_9BACT|nr:SpoIIE family protein phosphatase [Rhabdobacter roseus]MBB5285091.1 sigma-B regulation protein RsbU (phosphoserine phosphatase) [Rhabdobacter roseus]
MAIRILSVDDELDMETLITQLFRKQIREKKYEFIFANNGIEALDKLDEVGEVDLILSDINMPGMDGLTLLAKINEKNKPYLKAIMVSAYGDMDNIRTAMNRGAFDFITKPVNFEDLEITINKTVEHIEMLSSLEQGRLQLMALQNDLNVAKEIQLSMLPKTVPPAFAEVGVDLHAFIHPAKVVGGDLFDYHIMDAERVFFMIGDVSDKGIPAALFMAITKAIFKSQFCNKIQDTLCEKVNIINAFLSEDNSSFMFVTAWIGILNIKTGVVEYVDAGHEPPVIIRADGSVELVKKHGGMALCIDGDFDYTSQTLTLSAGDRLVLYTDGVTDANNLSGERYGLNLLQEFYAQRNFSTAQEINEATLATLIQFMGAASQFDDITMLTLGYTGTV